MAGDDQRAMLVLFGDDVKPVFSTERMNYCRISKIRVSRAFDDADSHDKVSMQLSLLCENQLIGRKSL
jgi:hypothetical protein